MTNTFCIFGQCFFLRLLLFPVAIIFGIVVFFRNRLYDIGILSSLQFKIPIISIGNLSMGGTGKTPMTEYLIRLLKEKYSLAILSRGYRRRTKGFLPVKNNSTSFHVGDEPVQFKKKFSDVVVAVDENRKHGIKKILSLFPETKLILLDDAFQHRRVKPGLSILLTDYNKIYYEDFIFPVGTLREWSSGKSRADIIIVTKSPENISSTEKIYIIKKINLEPHQHVFFSYIKYGKLYPLSNISTFRHLDILKDFQIILLTGISNSKPLEDFLCDKVSKIISLSYPDHHEYSLTEINKLDEIFNSIADKKKLIITTEKDAMRLNKPELMEALQKLPVYYLPIEIFFLGNEKEEFEKIIYNYSALR
ncbi:MAG: tetraacyldisaccharide 4'-kinase [Bacteroidota bacterium]